MDFRASLEQEMLRESVMRFVSSEQPFEGRQRRMDEGGAGAWAKLADVGWLAMAVPEEAGGLGSQLVDIAIVCEELGRGLSNEPFISSAVLPARILSRATPSDATTEALSELAVGTRRVGVALFERGQRNDVFNPATSATRTSDGTFVLRGKKILVGGGSHADWLIVSARLVGLGEGSECALLLVDTKRPGVFRNSYRTLDDVDAADFEFADVQVDADAMLAFSDGAPASLDCAIDEANICLCADILGGMSRAVDLTAEYLRIRTQFGKPLAEQQVLQHSLAEMFVDVSDVRSILYHALGSADLAPRLRKRAVAACKIKVMETAKWVNGMAIHLHGGIGVTEEYQVGHYLRRTIACERLFGGVEHHFQSYLNTRG